MADDDISYDVIVNYITRNAASSLKEIERYDNALKELTATGATSKVQTDAADRALRRMHTQFQTGLGTLNKYGQGFRKLGSEVQTLEQRFQKLAQSYAARGSKDPASAALTHMNLSQSQIDRINSHAVASSTTLQGALKDQAREQEKVAAATDASASATDQYSTGSLPRLRYALYDVSSTLTIAGAAMVALTTATLGAAISMDREFADVVRTTEAYLDDTGAAAAGLRDEFNELFATMPVSWGDLTEIGTLAGQLNIATANVAEFTELVAMFAATTDVSVEQAATAFGRLSQLLDVPASEFENLGSSILAVGVNSVATESDIISISTQITAMAASAGFSADEVFGLSSALASLGTQPELSRGVITRLFTNINNAITDGSDRLEKFGAVAGMSGKQFADAWGSDASGTLLRMLEGVGGQEGAQAVSTLNELGIVAARDVPTLLRLAQNSDVLADSLQVAAQGYADGTALSEQYGVVAQTVAERLQVLWQNVQLLFTAFGDTESALGPLIDGLTSVVQTLTRLADNKVVQVVSLITVGVIGLVGALGLLAGAVTRGAAGMLAIRTAMVDLNAASATTPLTLRGVAGAIMGVGAASTGTAANVRSLALSMIGLEAGATKAAVGVRLLNTALKTTVIGAAVAGGFWLVSKSIDAISDAMRSSTEVAEDFFGDLQGFSEAVAMDNAADYAGKVFGEITIQAPQAARATDDARNAADSWLGTQREVPGAADDATNSLREQNFVLGENAEAWLKNAVASTQAFQDFANDPELRAAAERAGLDMQEFIAAGLQGGDSFDQAVAKLNEALREEIMESGAVLGDSPAAVQQLAEFINDELAPAIRGVHDDFEAAAVSNDLLGNSAENTSRSLEQEIAALDDLLDGMLDAPNAIIATQNALFSLGEGLRETGADFDYFSANGRDNLGNLMGVMEAIAAESGGNAAQTIANLQALFDYLVIGGYASAEQLQILRETISSLKSETAAAIPQATLDFNSFFGGWESGAEKATKASRKAREEIRTLADYAKDLASVWDRAFEIRFSSQSTLDGIMTTFQGLRDEATASAERVADLRGDIRDLGRDIKGLHTEISGLQQDRSMQEYFLSIAEQYGDAKRAAEIRAEIAKLDQEIADKRADISEKQKEAGEKTKEANEEIASQSKILTGNSKEAIENRNKIRDLVAQYQAHIAALAQSGLSEEELRHQTEQLRQDFVNQATQLGYNRDELRLYEAGFTDVTEAINNVPRNITVDANVNPALQALNEFEARARAAAENAADAIATGNGSGYHVPEITLPVKAEIQSMEWGGKASRDAGFQIPGTPIQVQPGYAGGGFTGRGGKYDPAGIVHRGEYVVRKEFVNQRTGLPYADALGRLSRGVEGRTGYAGGGFVSGLGASGFGRIDSFGPMAAQQLAMALRQQVTLDSGQIAQSSATQFANSSAVGGA